MPPQFFKYRNPLQRSSFKQVQKQTVLDCNIHPQETKKIKATKEVHASHFGTARGNNKHKHPEIEADDAPSFLSSLPVQRDHAIFSVDNTTAKKF